VGRKPNSVPRRGVVTIHLGRTVTGLLVRPTRGSLRGPRNPPIWSCSGWGLPDELVTQPTGELLPHHFTLTTLTRGGMFLWHFPWGHPHWVLPSTLPSGVRTFLRQKRFLPATT